MRTPSDTSLRPGDSPDGRASGSPSRSAKGGCREGQRAGCLHQNHVSAARGPTMARMPSRFLASGAAGACRAAATSLALARTDETVATVNKQAGLERSPSACRALEVQRDARREARIASWSSSDAEARPHRQRAASATAPTLASLPPPLSGSLSSSAKPAAGACSQRMQTNGAAVERRARKKRRAVLVAE